MSPQSRYKKSHRTNKNERAAECNKFPLNHDNAALSEARPMPTT